MNQDQVKSMLLEIEPSPSPFTLLFSGKKSVKVNGLYKPEKAEIIIHNQNFDSDDQLFYTAIHEYAHHLHSARLGGLGHSRPHNLEFWAIFHDLLEKAEEKGLFRNVFDTEPEFLTLTKTIKQTCIEANGEIMLEFGRLLAKAAELCGKYKMRFEDYIERVLGLPKSTAATAATASRLGLDPRLGWDGFKYAVSIRDPEARDRAIEALQKGDSPAAAKGRLKMVEAQVDPANRLLEEKSRIEKMIRNLSARLEKIEQKLSEL
ncbi:MAG: hypothetical protein NT061_09815 [Spirochaetes bacterium]|nr:hypothetical protein [Spirochaetota bacterium]